MGDLSQIAPLDSVARMSRQLVYDSSEWQDVGRGLSAAVSLLDSRHRLDLADLNWRRLTALRQALVHACLSARGRSCLESLVRGRVRVVHRPGDGALAWLAVGWLASRLHWTGDVRPAVEEGRDMGHDDAVLAVHLDDAAASLSAVLDDRHVVVRTADTGTPVTTLVPHESRAFAVTAELRNLTHDVCLHDAIRAARSFLHAARSFLQ
jgi:glucose-6-phosphate dehydrogenase assembly protein OpcA